MNNLFKSKQCRFSLRKYSFGLASALIGITFLIAPNVLAEEQSTIADTSSQVVQVENSNTTATENVNKSTTIEIENEGNTAAESQNNFDTNEENVAQNSGKDYESLSPEQDTNSKNEVINNSTQQNSEIYNYSVATDAPSGSGPSQNLITNEQEDIANIAENQSISSPDITMGVKRASAGVTVSAYTKPVDADIYCGFDGYPGHGGIDYAVPDGTPVRAARDGVVTFSGDGSNHSWMTWLAGNCILIQHSDGIYTGYAHLSSVVVSAGSSVKQGQIIGYSGHTGYVTGPHLHFEMLPANPNFGNGYSGRIDPTPYIVNAPYHIENSTSSTSSPTANNLKIYRVDDLQFVNGIWQVRCDALVPTGFTWADNGIAAADIDEVDGNGNKTADQVLQKGSYFVINPSNVRSVGAPLVGTGGLPWSQVNFAHGDVIWLRVNNSDNLLYGT